MKPLRVKLCQSFRREPLAEVEGLGEFTPVQLRALAATLQRVADDAEQQPMDQRHYSPKRREYAIGNAAPLNSIA